MANPFFDVVWTDTSGNSMFSSPHRYYLGIIIKAHTSIHPPIHPD
jgi:hypothetical protein